MPEIEKLTDALEGAPDFIEERCWDIARIIAAVDKQLISSDAVKAFAQFARQQYALGVSAGRQENEDAKRLDKLEAMGDIINVLVDSDLPGEHPGLYANAFEGKTLRAAIDAIKEPV